jgi:putative flippase GtrA
MKAALFHGVFLQAKKLSAKFFNLETARYAAAGFLTTMINIGVYSALIFWNIDYKAANLTALICAKLFAFFANKKYVFRSRCSSRLEFIKETLLYAAARSFTALLDFVLLIIAVEIFCFDRRISKYAITGLVIIINYILLKKIVYVNKGEKS